MIDEQIDAAGQPLDGCQRLFVARQDLSALLTQSVCVSLIRTGHEIIAGMKIPTWKAHFY